LPPRTTVKWIFNAAEAEGFTQDGCNDLGVSSVDVALDGEVEQSGSDACSTHQVVFTDLPPGPYQATVVPRNSNGDSLVTAPVVQEVIAEETDVEQMVVIPWDAWIGPYDGDFFFTIRWGGMDCAQAAPVPVDTQTITLTVQGIVVSQTTTTGEALDGTAPFACVPASNPSPISALSIPFGPATILIVGHTGGVESFRTQFDTFIGAGPSNPTLNYDVATIYDAGPPDAGPPDAGPPDAMP
jgi:hypothetical protein